MNLQRWGPKPLPDEILREMLALPAPIRKKAKPERTKRHSWARLKEIRLTKNRAARRRLAAAERQRMEERK